jgi:hypothetical protein
MIHRPFVAVLKPTTSSAASHAQCTHAARANSRILKTYMHKMEAKAFFLPQIMVRPHRRVIYGVSADLSSRSLHIALLSFSYSAYGARIAYKSVLMFSRRLRTLRTALQFSKLARRCELCYVFHFEGADSGLGTRPAATFSTCKDLHVLVLLNLFQ